MQILYIASFSTINEQSEYSDIQCVANTVLYESTTDVEIFSDGEIMKFNLVLLL